MPGYWLVKSINRFSMSPPSIRILLVSIHTYVDNTTSILEGTEFLIVDSDSLQWIKNYLFVVGQHTVHTQHSDSYVCPARITQFQISPTFMENLPNTFEQ